MPDRPRQTAIRYTTKLLDHGDDREGGDFELDLDLPPESLEVTTRYLLHQELGQGGAGKVYRAHDSVLGRDVAIKILRRSCLDQPLARSQFEQEARIICSMQHPSIPQIYDFGLSTDGRPFYSMKIVDGKSLHHLIAESTASLRAELLTQFAQVCNAIAYTHSRGLVHLDIKPANIMVGSFGEVHVMDWGNAKQIRDCHAKSGDAHRPSIVAEDEVTQIGGTLGYMAPEHVARQPITERFDVFAIGASLCHILTGAPPYQGNSFTELYHQSIQCDMSQVFKRLDCCGYDQAVIDLTKACLSGKPADRPANGGEVAQALSSYQKSAVEQYASDMRQFFELSLDLFCIADLNGFFRRINGNFSRVLGTSEAELLHQPFINFVHPDDRESTIAQVSLLAEGKPVVRFRNRYRRADGDYVRLEWTSKTVHEHGLIYAVARLVDEPG
jgi:serine/threonine-protein kinase